MVRLLTKGDGVQTVVGRADLMYRNLTRPLFWSRKSAAYLLPVWRRVRAVL